MPRARKRSSPESRPAHHAGPALEGGGAYFRSEEGSPVKSSRSLALLLSATYRPCLPNPRAPSLQPSDDAPRANHTATLFPMGILIAGGIGRTHSPLQRRRRSLRSCGPHLAGIGTMTGPHSAQRHSTRRWSRLDCRRRRGSQREIYDFATGAFAATGAMVVASCWLQPRPCFRTAGLPAGQPTAQIYDPAAGTPATVSCGSPRSPI